MSCSGSSVSYTPHEDKPIVTWSLYSGMKLFKYSSLQLTPPQKSRSSALNMASSSILPSHITTKISVSVGSTSG